MKNYIENFLKELNENINEVSWKDVALAIKILSSVYEANGKVYLIGNGGSSAIASHFANDLNKTVLGKNKESKRFQALSLCDNTPVLTAWANDFGYENIFSEQLKNFSREKDALIAISSSGNSPNIIKAAEVAKKANMPIIGMTGFNGGELIKWSNAKIHIPSFKYSIVESSHDAISHLITAYFEDLIK